MHPRDLASLAGEETIFGGFAAEKLERLQAELEPLSGRYDVVVANPPYMGSKNMNKWLGDWVKTHHKDVKGDLFSCFMVRNVGMGAEHAQLGFMTPYVWMFIGTYEKLRKFVIQQNTITSLIQLEYSGFSGATVPICTFTLQKGYCPGYRGGYVRLSDFVGADQQAPRALEALANPDCGWFYRADAQRYSTLPGSPITYWVVPEYQRLCLEFRPLEANVHFKEGITTGNNDAYLRYWHEVEWSHFSINAIQHISRVWIPCNKGGSFRRWYGNNDYVIDWTNDGSRLASYSGSSFRNSAYQRLEGVTYSNLSSGCFAARYSPHGFAFESKGTTCFSEDPYSTLAYFNSSLFGEYTRLVCPTLDFKFGVLQKLPDLRISRCEGLAKECVQLSRYDWDSFESSWDFKCHPLV